MPESLDKEWVRCPYCKEWWMSPGNVICSVCDVLFQPAFITIETTEMKESNKMELNALQEVANIIYILKERNEYRLDSVSNLIGDIRNACDELEGEIDNILDGDFSDGLDDAFDLIEEVINDEMQMAPTGNDDIVDQLTNEVLNWKVRYGNLYWHIGVKVLGNEAGKYNPETGSEVLGLV